VTKFLLTGGGTAGHVNPLLAIAQQLRGLGHEVLVLGTAEGLEARLVPEQNFELLTIARLPFPRKISLSALAFPVRFIQMVAWLRAEIKRREIECVVGFGGYVSAPAYLAAWLARLPLVIHEANALPGMANRLGALLTKHRAVAFANTPLSRAELTGMPLRAEVVAAIDYNQQQARVELGLDPATPTLLVTGGSLGAKRINDTVLASLDALRAAGIQTYHVVGDRAGLEPVSEPLYQRVSYCERMDVAIAASDMAISRAGAATVSEFCALGLPALYVPYPVGNGEQRRNVETAVAAGAGFVISDAEFEPSVIVERVIPLISSPSRLADFGAAAKSVAIIDGTERLMSLISKAVDTSQHD
jgi:UDP-N-acetylglucosamine--N-acetylmuramyl-(pentapeptide) pyrophosphoryl-undecaprenol N-acetylglucosamine transferase